MASIDGGGKVGASEFWRGSGFPRTLLRRAFEDTGPDQSRGLLEAALHLFREAAQHRAFALPDGFAPRGEFAMIAAGRAQSQISAADAPQMPDTFLAVMPVAVRATPRRVPPLVIQAGGMAIF